MMMDDVIERDPNLAGQSCPKCQHWPVMPRPCGAHGGDECDICAGTGVARICPMCGLNLRKLEASVIDLVNNWRAETEELRKLWGDEHD